MNPWIWTAVTTVTVCASGWLLQRRFWMGVFKRGTQLLVEETVQLKLDLKTQEDDHAARTETLHGELKQALADIQSARAETKVESDKRSRYFDKISEVQAERDQWYKLYTAQSIGHGNAQALMMGTIEQLARQMKAKGIEPKIPRILQDVRAEFQTTHEEPARLAAAQQSAPALQSGPSHAGDPLTDSPKDPMVATDGQAC